MNLDCTSSLQNISEPGCVLNLGQYYSLIFVPITQEFADEATALTEANWTTLINAASASRARIVKNIDNPTPEDEDKPMFETDNKNRYPVRDGFRRLTISKFMPPLCFIEALKSLGDGSNWGLYIVTENKYIICQSDDGTKIQPMLVKTFIDNVKQQPSADEPHKIDLMIDFDDPDLMMSYVINPSLKDTDKWDPKKLDGIVNCYFEEVTSAAGELVFKVWSKCGKAPIEDLVIGDFNITGASSVTNVGNVYTVVGTFASPVDLLLTDQPTATTKGYESPSALNVTF